VVNVVKKLNVSVTVETDGNTNGAVVAGSTV